MTFGAAGLLLAAVAGYWVLERAETHKGNLRRSGRVLGWVIILTSLIGVVCRVWCLTHGPSPMMGKSAWCPFSAPTPAPTP